MEGQESSAVIFDSIFFWRSVFTSNKALNLGKKIVSHCVKIKYLSFLKTRNSISFVYLRNFIVLE